MKNGALISASRIAILLAICLSALSPLSLYAATNRQTICAASRQCTSDAGCGTGATCVRSDVLRSTCSITTAGEGRCLSSSEQASVSQPQPGRDTWLAQEYGATPPTESGATTINCLCGMGTTRNTCVTATDVGSCGNLTSTSPSFQTAKTQEPSLANFACDATTPSETDFRAISANGRCQIGPVGTGGLAAAVRAGQGSTTPASTTSTATPPFVPVVPVLGVPIPGLKFGTPTINDGTVTVPFIAQYISAAYKYLIAIGLTVTIIMLVYGGFRYLLGSSYGEISRGKEIITDALAGFLIILGAYLILGLVSDRVLQLNAIQLKTIVPEPVEFDRDIGFDPLGGGYVGEHVTPSAPGDPPPSAPYSSRPNAGTASTLPQADLSDYPRITDHPCMIASRVHPLYEPYLRRVGDRFCQLRGSQTGLKIACGGYRDPYTQLQWSLQRCLNRTHCTVATCNNLPRGYLTRENGILVTADPNLRSLTPDQVFQTLRGVIGADIEAAKTRCPHTSGVAVDCHIIGSDRPGGEFTFYVPNQILMERAFKEAGGICRLRHESWHFEPDQYRITRGACLADWTIGVVEKRQGQIDQYGSQCTNGIWSYDNRRCTGNTAQ